MKYEWRKKEKHLYLPKNRPEIIDLPQFNFLTIKGEGHPSSDWFSACVESLYSISYAVKMTLKISDLKPPDYVDYTVYPLEGIWDLNDEAKKVFTGTINKNDFVYTLMIRQPAYVDLAFVNEMVNLIKKKKQHLPLDHISLEEATEGKCIQMLHIGSYDEEPTSFKEMELFAESKNLIRQSKKHREIYLSDFRKVPAEKLKTVLRFQVH